MEQSPHMDLDGPAVARETHASALGWRGTLSSSSLSPEAINSVGSSKVVKIILFSPNKPPFLDVCRAILGCEVAWPRVVDSV